MGFYFLDPVGGSEKALGLKDLKRQGVGPLRSHFEGTLDVEAFAGIVVPRWIPMAHPGTKQKGTRWQWQHLPLTEIHQNHMGPAS